MIFPPNRINRKMRTPVLLLAAFMIVASASAQQPPPPSQNMISLVEAERAFSRTSVEKGMREAFLKFFANDGINFQPHPVKTREALLSSPAPSGPPPITLSWEPVYADISTSGDFGYTLGPFTITDQTPENRPPAYGVYFSVWEKDWAGNWKVAIDAGIRTPGQWLDTANTSGFRGAPIVATKPYPDSALGDSMLRAADRAFLEDVNAVGITEAYRHRYVGRTRVHRNGFYPFINSDSLAAYLANVAFMTWEPIGSSMATSGEIGYTYGSYEQRGKKGEVEKGYYVRVWRLGRDNTWKVVLDTTHPLPPEEPGEK